MSMLERLNQAIDHPNDSPTSKSEGVPNQGLKVFVKFLRKRAECRWCAQPILAGEIVVEGWGYRSGRRWGGFWHFRRPADEQNCWDTEQYEFWSKQVFEPHPGRPVGKPRLNITDEQKARRHVLLVRAYRINKEIQNAIRLGWSWQLPRLRAEIKALEPQLEEVGGVPRGGKVWA